MATFYQPGAGRPGHTLLRLLQRPGRSPVQGRHLRL